MNLGHSNIEERNTDFQTINQGLLFPRGRAIDGHEYVYSHRMYNGKGKLY
jgi:hypothetical protein